MPITAGQVLLDPFDDHLMIAWERSALGHWLAMPMHRQTAPLHRAQHRIEADQVEALLGKLYERTPMLVDTHIRRIVPDDAALVTECPGPLVFLIRATLNRALASANAERLHGVSSLGPARGVV
jgi:hypothetical protein